MAGRRDHLPAVEPTSATSSGIRRPDSRTMSAVRGMTFGRRDYGQHDLADDPCTKAGGFPRSKMPQ
ncbi:MAG: hypothetical protein ABSA93_12460 [Streptosporangiaceae bacterium]